MSLSDQERRLLDEMERNLYKNEEGVVYTELNIPKPDYKIIILAIIGVIAGFAWMFIAIHFKMPALSVIGFAVAAASVYYMVLPKNRRKDESSKENLEQMWRDNMGESDSGSSDFDSQAKNFLQNNKKTSFTDKLNKRWDKRFGQD